MEDQFLKEFKDDLDLVFCKYTIHFPFWAVLGERCSFSITKSKVPTAAVDKFGHILFNIDFIKNLKNKYKSQYIKKLLFIIAHEIGHFAFEFFDRLGKRDLKGFNVAHDYAINLLLYYQFEKNMEYLIPECLLDECFKDMCAEEIYEKIKDNFNKSFVVDVYDADFGEGEGSGSNGENSGSENEIVIRKRRVELPSKEGKTDGEFEDEFKNYMQSAMNDAYTLAKSQGLMPSNMERAILRHLKPKIDWLSAFRQKLRFGISRVEKRDTTWQMPNRRFLESNYIFPSSIGPESPKIAYAVDTSGSMSQEDIDQAMAELEEIRKKFQAKVYLLDCDADIHNSRWLNYFEPLPRLDGGGGTDFRPVFEHLENKRINPDYCVFFTDGMGEFGQKPNVAYNILWILTTDARPPFGECIRINVPNE